MQIHVVRPGDTLWRISQMYSVTVDLLAQSNEIPDPNQTGYWSDHCNSDMGRYRQVLETCTRSAFCTMCPWLN